MLHKIERRQHQRIDHWGELPIEVMSVEVDERKGKKAEFFGALAMREVQHG